jgi:hypothetical protein
MTSRRQADANRRNATRSTGPRTPEGRAISSANAVRHGVLSNRFVAGHENPDLFRMLREDLVAEFEPETTFESLLVERLAMLFWRERRLAVAESEQVDLQFAQGGGPNGGEPRSLPIVSQFLVGRYQGMLGKQIKETIRDLRAAQQSRLRYIEFTDVDAANGGEAEF